MAHIQLKSNKKKKQKKKALPSQVQILKQPECTFWITRVDLSTSKAHIHLVSWGGGGVFKSLDPFSYGPVMEGGLPKIEILPVSPVTMTLKSQSTELPCSSANRYETGVVPMPKLSPEFAVDVTTRLVYAVVSSVAVGKVHVTVAVDCPPSALTTISLGQEVRVGLVVSVRSALVQNKNKIRRWW